ncbi:hypothetical protein BXT86_04870 [candidate division WOR-3 bacterium 4484_100]|uniref:NlpC/P60 domain-containing protein n=1 Tax=candidate division WOR-3 bacterium 4484_100 TaxID=1936077 RepID=A0A1V4QGB2_UNCW3|nr:MAG: hypothetical protein BXT86_04870 [candidate division WOR-3 bacterium 4484_100]
MDRKKFSKLLPGILFGVFLTHLSGQSIERVYIVSRVFPVNCQVDSGVPSSQPKYPVLDSEEAFLGLVVEFEKDNKKFFISPWKKVIIGGKEIVTEAPEDFGLEQIKILWYKVEPVRGNKKTGFRYYSNEDWVEKDGILKKIWHWDKLNYKEFVWDSSNTWIIKADVIPVELDSHPFGTMRYKVEVKFNNQMISSPGAESVKKDGDIDAHRISVRGNTGNKIIDWAYSFFNLPFIWGSASRTGRPCEHQTEKYIGADCADFVVGIFRKAGYDMPYTGSQSLLHYANIIASPDSIDNKGFYIKNGARIKFDGNNNEAVIPGNIVLWSRHAAILAFDNGNKFLDQDDIVIHTLFHEPTFEKISNAYSGNFTIARFKFNDND